MEIYIYSVDQFRLLKFVALFQHHGSTHSVSHNFLLNPLQQIILFDEKVMKFKILNHQTITAVLITSTQNYQKALTNDVLTNYGSKLYFLTVRTIYSIMIMQTICQVLELILEDISFCIALHGNQYIIDIISFRHQEL